MVWLNLLESGFARGGSPAEIALTFDQYRHGICTRKEGTRVEKRKSLLPWVNWYPVSWRDILTEFKTIDLAVKDRACLELRLLQFGIARSHGAEGKDQPTFRESY
jgi:hypothetical protein